ncbi:putative phosphonate transport system ATP-binding protein [Angulomicrobium tetraedrale]|uniref:Putative phosphonate transport system ATP-binding protein n=1 Tax=Ancylobacter tetraedralis TaxID=217068 RepID=A0A839Z3G2_9HYPH|nr:ATP-binding cassette domain-containing protein [Ancylobacter tetraedralis]MBB3769441.1 putative phosphonate transport system ATP-binding protein [Ancylobacter tetraedralis]
MSRAVVLRASGLRKVFGGRVVACADIDFELAAGEVVGIVGESGSGKSTLLRCLAGLAAPDAGTVEIAIDGGERVDLWQLDEVARAQALRSALGLVHQNPRDGLKLGISAGGNVAEPLMVSGIRHYGRLREVALDWLERVEVPRRRIDDLPSTFSGGMQQRLQIARSLAPGPRILLLDEPTGGLDVSVQARLLDLLRSLVRELGVAALIVTHDLGVARLLADRLLVMLRGRVIEAGLADQVLDDPQAPYTQKLVASMLRI